MSRTEARIKTSIWSNDPDFIALPSGAQRLYLLLCSQSTINLCGVIALTTGRWARMASDTTPESIEADLAILESERYIIIDRGTQELFVRTLMKHDHVLEIPKVRGAATAQLETVISLRIYNEIAVVLGVPTKVQANTLYPNPVYPIPKNDIPICAGARADSRLQTPDSRLQTPDKSDLEPSPENLFEPLLEAPEPEKQPRKKRASLVPDDFPITDEMRTWARANGITISLEDATEDFLDYWRGEGKLKADWIATWRNGMKSRQARAQSRGLTAVNGNGRAPAPTRFETETRFLIDLIREGEGQRNELG